MCYKGCTGKSRSRCWSVSLDLPYLEFFSAAQQHFFFSTVEICGADYTGRLFTNVERLIIHPHVVCCWIASRVPYVILTISNPSSKECLSLPWSDVRAPFDTTLSDIVWLTQWNLKSMLLKLKVDTTRAKNCEHCLHYVILRLFGSRFKCIRSSGKGEGTRFGGDMVTPAIW
jgi:hypothetical protein